jgi:hypothetical protein
MYLLLSSNAGLTMNLHCTVHVESIANVITNPSAIQSNPIQSNPINQSIHDAGMLSAVHAMHQYHRANGTRTKHCDRIDCLFASSGSGALVISTLLQTRSRHCATQCRLTRGCTGHKKQVDLGNERERIQSDPNPINQSINHSLVH